MKKYFIVIFLMLAWSGLTASAAAPAMAVPPTLAIAEIKVTGDEFIILKNNTGFDIPDLGTYWLSYFNNYNPLGAGVSSSSQQLPSVKLPNGQNLLLSSNGMAACGAAVAGKFSISLSDSSGYLQVSQMGLGSLGVSQLPVDSVSWSSAAGTAAAITGVNSKDPASMYYRTVSGAAYGWQLADPDSSNPCQLNVSGGGTLSSGLVQSGSAVPSVVAVGAAAGVSVPADDIGLAAPQISEVLPNPAPPQTDADNEFIELYNSNSQPFDLSGFILQVGTTTLHKYTFDNNTSLQPHQFSAFYSSDTGLSLSNSNGQVKFLDPSGNVLGQTDEYGTAKDGYAWVSADGLWQWTTTATPSAPNIITAPVSKSSKSTAGSSSTKKSSKSPAAAAVGSNYTGGSSGPAAASSLHPAILAGIGLVALLYAGYEYRHDLANQLYKFRRYREARRVAG